MSRVTSMTLMVEATEFNGDISKCNVSRVTDMSGMFPSARSFEGCISKWDVSKVEDMSHMFSSASFFKCRYFEMGRVKSH